MLSLCPFSKSSRSQSGFTLIELMVVISIIAIMFGIDLSSYNTFNRNQILQQAAENLRSDLRLAQNKALAGQKPVNQPTFCNGGTLIGYGFTINAFSYSFAAYCSDGTVSAPVKSVDLAQKNVGLVYTAPKLIFLVLGRGVDLGSSERQTITLNSAGQSRYIDVSPQGVIKLYSPGAVVTPMEDPFV